MSKKIFCVLMHLGENLDSFGPSFFLFGGDFYEDSWLAPAMKVRKSTND